MNATPPTLNPGNALQTASPSGKPADAAAADTPFSQVLSGEIARQGGEPRDDTPPGAVRRGETAGEAADAADAPTDAAQQLAGAIGLGASADLEATTELPGLPQEDAATDTSDAVADAVPGLPDALLGLVMPAPPVQQAAVTAPTQPPAETPDGPAISLETRGRRADLAARGAEPATGTAPGTRTGQPDPDQLPAAAARAPAVAAKAPGDAAATPAPAVAAAAAFSEQLAARQSDAAKAGERMAELMNHPALRAAAHAAAAEAVPAAAGPASSRLAPAVGTPAWNQALGDKLVWMVNGAQQTASLTLNPPNLGPLQIVLDVKNDQATASFYAAQPEVRQALESALPRLRDMMTDAGIQLGQATVSADTPRQHDTPDRQAPQVASGRGGADPAGPSVQTGTAPIPARIGRGLVDTFA